MFTIGDFSKLSRVSVKTLRYYDEVGLFKPQEVDPCTSYRYYSASQLPRLNRLLVLKDLGFSLEQIAQLLQDGLSQQELRGMLRLKLAEIQQRMQQDQERLAKVETRLKQIEMEDHMPTYDVILKDVEPQLVAAIRDTMPSYQDIGPLYEELSAHLQRYGAMSMAKGTSLALWHDSSFKPSDVDGEAAFSLKSPVPETERVKVYELPGATMASVVHHGSYSTLGEAYKALSEWIEANGYKIVGSGRELYLYNTYPVRQDDESYVTELQFPVAKA